MSQLKIKDDEKTNLVITVVIIAVILVLLALVVVTIWEMIDLVLLTFIITFLFYHCLKSIKKRLGKKIVGKVPDGVLLFFIYIIAIAIVAVLSVSFVPRLVVQITEIANFFMDFDINSVRDALGPRITEFLWEFDLNPYISEAGSTLMDSVAKIGVFGLNLLFAFLLSFMILLEKDKIYRFGETVKNSKISFVHESIMKFGGSFVQTFGKVMKVQVIISLVNCLLSMLVLFIMGFPAILGLGIMIFLLGLIPVAGVIISLIPLCIIGFSIGGFKVVLGVIIMIVVIHAIEAYILNPKLMSNRTSLPVCFVFIILLVSEHFLKVWGLLIGVPLFIFLMKSFEVDYQEACKPKPIFRKDMFNRFKKSSADKDKKNTSDQ